FDAAECLVDYLKETNTDYKSLFVTDFNNPGTLINAKNSFYLISPKRKSPMGENLSAYKSESDASNAKNSLGGEVLDWTGLYNQLGK
ncbi:MAG: nitrous oxide reductase accessory protein NosL, partial [Ignavibacteria bacterium]|nr:nitrous oxide reductase accessory protein NosL [Ignavibacteria bacterium]